MTTIAAPTPVVSVIVPAFNAGDTILEALESIFATGFSPLEVIVVDDGSTDGSREVVKRYRGLHQDHRIVLTSHPEGKNHGASASRNLGVDCSTGKYIAFLDADDLYRPSRLAASVRLLESQPHLSAVFGTFLYELSGPSETNQIRDISSDLVKAVESQVLVSPADEDFLSQLLRGKSGLCTNTITVRKQVFIEAGGFPSLRYGEDLALWLRIFATGEVARVEDGPLAVYRIHGHSLCSKGEQSAEFILGPVHSLINAVQWLKSRTEGREALQRIRRMIPGKLFHQYAKISKSTHSAKVTMRQTMVSAALACPQLLLDRRFYSIFVRLFF